MESREKLYANAKEQYAQVGVNTDEALNRLQDVKLSLHCWQADDVGGFENQGVGLDGGLAATGNYPGKARTMTDLKNDMFKVYSLIPGKHRFSIHAFYGDFREKQVDRDKIAPEQFRTWAEWAKHMNIGIDFNSTFFMIGKSFSLAFLNR